DPGTTFNNVDLSLPNARALGFSADNGGFPDGTIGLNTSICNLDASQTNPAKFSLFAVVCHEIDEVLGTVSDVGSTTSLTPVDLFRYNSGGRSFTTSTSEVCFFSLDGTTNLAQYNQDGAGDYGDWISPVALVQVQDAYATAGTTPVPGVELRVLDVV